jgi:hypothetical protein
LGVVLFGLGLEDRARDILFVVLSGRGRGLGLSVEFRPGGVVSGVLPGRGLGFGLSVEFRPGGIGCAPTWQSGLEVGDRGGTALAA